MPTKPSWNCCLTSKDKGHMTSEDESIAYVFSGTFQSLCSFTNYPTQTHCEANLQLRTDFILFPCINLLNKIC